MLHNLHNKQPTLIRLCTQQKISKKYIQEIYLMKLVSIPVSNLQKIFFSKVMFKPKLTRSFGSVCHLLR